MQKPIIEWNTTKKIWQVSKDNHLFELWEPFLATWPTSGLMQDGQVSELQMPERHTSDSEFSLLPTATASDKNDRQKSENWKGNDLVSTVKDELLPTTRTSMANGATRKEVQAGNPKSRIETEVLLMPTPTAVDGNTVAKSELDANDPKHRLKVAAQVLARDGVNWGKFEPAIRRWEEVLGRSAPSPTKPDGKDGANRLSSAFTEWMMGVPEGWITDCGLKRNEELKACGNGVVPQQAELALRILLEGFTIPTGGGASEFTNANG